jgi:mono/diheme cytochrome c family protein
LFLSCNLRDRDLPGEYRNLAVPRARLSSARSREHGRRLFLDHCALCHGVNADGHGLRREGLTTPRDFTSRDWARRTSPRHVFYAIREGIAGTAMPAWKSFATEDAWDLASYLLSVAEGTP